MCKKLFIFTVLFFSLNSFAQTKLSVAPTGSYLTNTLNEQALLMGIEIGIRMDFIEIPLIGRGTRTGNDLLITGAGGLRFIFFDTIAISGLGGYTKIGNNYKTAFYGTDISLLIPVGSETELIPFVEYDLDLSSQKRSFLIGVKLNIELFNSKGKKASSDLP